MNFVESVLENWSLVNQTTSKIDFDNKRMKVDNFKLKEIVFGIIRKDQFLYIDSQIWLQVQFLIATVFFPPPLDLDPLSSGVSYILYLPLNDLSPPLVDCLSYYSSAWPIGHPYRPFMNWENQDSTVQGSSSHKCGKRFSYRALNAVIAVFS